MGNICHILLFLIITSACSPNGGAEQNSGNSIKSEINIPQKEIEIEYSSATDTIEVIVLPCANGYEYAMHGYDFNALIEQALDSFSFIHVQPFPYKAMMDVPYHGIFDKKYAKPILEITDADFFIFTRFIGNKYDLVSSDQAWGYETRILNTETMEQINSIRAENLNSYEELENDIRESIGRLSFDIERLR